MHFIRNIIISLSVLLIVVLFYACRKLDKEGPATATVSIVLSHSQSTSRMARVSTSFNAGTDTELIALVPDNTTFNQKYLSLENRYQFALTDLSTDTVSLTVPLDTGIKLYSYAYFDEKFTLSELENTATQAEQFGETSSFTISSSDTSKNVSLKYFVTELRSILTIIPSPVILLSEYENLSFFISGIFNSIFSSVGILFGKLYTSDDEAKNIFLIDNSMIVFESFRNLSDFYYFFEL